MSGEYGTEAERQADAPSLPASPNRRGAHRPPLDTKQGIVALDIIGREQLVNRRTILWVFCSVLFALFPLIFRPHKTGFD